MQGRQADQGRHLTHDEAARLAGESQVRKAAETLEGFGDPRCL
jgi:hypothetical protein